ncbi:MAG: hypothetical protein COY66_04965 [Candidatus Kerfeldbacteria bacterium CG_4_10_14_0_8_um_filter_42_10]|uniref:Uncharacterized protein n=1 Tax=Candidatus Kerfeldbacteria bacterium CG_4_10_14_0_8_um_filter_42_10 TaxID=2014248 RepID=A0A2M7RI70_9BACT|nr:MAG: hypothetical protein COY66_04965 [Candidatus Kerfeldbacteria bacterium CG_4_10_14_0_8_um_filter_42_10]
MAETNGENADSFVEVDGAKFQADPENEGQPLKDESGNPIPFKEEGDEEGGDDGATGDFVEVDGKKYVPDPDKPEEPLKDEQGNPVIFEDKKSKVEKEGEPGDPPVRDKKDFIINRLRQSRDKAREKAGNDNEGDDDEIDSEDEARILKVVDKHYGDKLSKVDAEENERELNSFFTNPENAKFKKKEATIRKWWKDPSRNHLPIKSVAYEVMGDSLEAVGAKKARQADDESRQSGSGGHTARGTMTKKNAWEETPEEFEAHQQKVRQKSN